MVSVHRGHYHADCRWSGWKGHQSTAVLLLLCRSSTFSALNQRDQSPSSPYIRQCSSHLHLLSNLTNKVGTLIERKQREEGKGHLPLHMNTCTQTHKQAPKTVRFSFSSSFQPVIRLFFLIGKRWAWSALSPLSPLSSDGEVDEDVAQEPSPSCG